MPNYVSLAILLKSIKCHLAVLFRVIVFFVLCVANLVVGHAINMKASLAVEDYFWRDFRKAKHFILHADAQNKELKVLR